MTSTATEDTQACTIDVQLRITNVQFRHILNPVSPRMQKKGLSL